MSKQLTFSTLIAIASMALLALATGLGQFAPENALAGSGPAPFAFSAGR